MPTEKYWLISENSACEDYYYMGYFEKGKPVFSIAIAEGVQIASFGSAKMVYDVLNTILPCEIWMIENYTRRKVFPEGG